MKVILSRKGFDSEYGGMPSPILPNGKMISLPIPSKVDFVKYKDLSLPDWSEYTNLYELMKDLRTTIKNKGENEQLTEDTTCHLDPDVYYFFIPRDKEWRPLFGQINAAESHLENQSVMEGDLFLFFGWFRRTIYKDGKLRFDPKDEGKHVIYAYLQIEEIINVRSDTTLPKWMEYHPHAISQRRKVNNNTIYVARKHLSWDDKLPGSFFFDYSDHLVLTKRGFKKSYWNLPCFFKDLKISYHSAKSWMNDGTFKSASKGQEFVIEENEMVEYWAKDLIWRSFNL